jgi:Txe/YoeB family toxin of Txe-Axe toxin-antitoxin module
MEQSSLTFQNKFTNDSLLTLNHVQLAVSSSVILIDQIYNIKVEIKNKYNVLHRNVMVEYSRRQGRFMIQLPCSKQFNHGPSYFQ